MTIKAKCSVCGKETELADNLASFVEKYPDRVKNAMLKEAVMLKKLQQQQKEVASLQKLPVKIR